MRAVDARNQLANETVSLGQCTVALILPCELDTNLSMLLNLTFLLHRSDNFSASMAVFIFLRT
jgi:hypothetical protein